MSTPVSSWREAWTVRAGHIGDTEIGLRLCLAVNQDYSYLLKPPAGGTERRGCGRAPRTRRLPGA